MVFVKNLKPRNDKHVSNSFEILNRMKDEYHLVIYYREPQKCKIIIRKLNNRNGWNHNLELKIYDQTSSEIIHLGSSTKNYKIINYYLKKIQLQKKEYKKIKIPKIIVQTHKFNELNDVLAMNAMYTFQELNPDYEYCFFNNAQCRKFIKKHFNDEYVYYYDILYPGAFKADYFRYCYLFIHGGFYFDFKNILLQPLDDLISEENELILCQDHHNTGYYNAVLMSTPKNVLFLELINKIKYKINHFQEIYGQLSKTKYNKLESILSLTGPNLLYEIFHEKNMDHHKYVLMKHDILGNYKKYQNLVVKFKGKIFLYKNYSDFHISSIHYSILWKQQQLFYYNHFFNNEYHFYLSPGNQKFINIQFYFINNYILLFCNPQDKKLPFIMIDPNHHQHNLLAQNIKNDYHLIKWETFKVEYCIQEVTFIDAEKKDFFFEINKVQDKYVLVILNESVDKWDSFSIQIRTKIKTFQVKIKKNNKNYQVIELQNFV